MLAAAGILDGLDATTHWLATALIEQHGAKAVAERLVRAGRVITTVGAVSAIEGALLVVGRAAGFDMADRVRAALTDDLDDAVGAQLAGVDPAPTWTAQTAPVSIDAYVNADPVGRPARTGRGPSRWARFASRGIRVENDR